MTPRPFRIDIPDADIADLRLRLCATRLADDHDNVDWRYGVERGWLAGMIDHWANHYDWRAREATINRHEHFVVEIDGISIHFQRIAGTTPNPMPIILTHGWPWTFLDWEALIGPLTDPCAHGGTARDGFDVIIPSLPGFAFSGPACRTGIGVRAIGRLWHGLMRDALGYSRFMAAGGDWGSLVSAELGHAFPESLIGVHLTLPRLPGMDPRRAAQADFAADERWMARRITAAAANAHSHLAVHTQAPQTLAYALADSPAGMAAWIWERRRNWSDCGGVVERAFTRDFLCDTASLYWFTRTIGSSMRLYAEHARAGWPALDDRPRRIEVPTAFAVAPGELTFIPRATAERLTRLERWSVLPRGGHFLPAEQPGLLVDEYRAFAATLR